MCESMLLELCDIDYFGFFYENKLTVIPESNKLYSGTNVTELDKP